MRKALNILWIVLAIGIVPASAKAQSARWHYAYFTFRQNATSIELQVVDPATVPLTTKTLNFPIPTGTYSTEKLSLSPSGTHLAIILRRENESPRLERLLYLIDLNTQEAVTIDKGILYIPTAVHWSQVIAFSWSPNGQYFAFNVRDDANLMHLWVYELTTSNLFMLSAQESMAFFGVSWSPDSRSLLTNYAVCGKAGHRCGSGEVGETGLMIFDVVTKQPSAQLKLTDAYYADHKFACPLNWSPDSRAITYITRCETQYYTNDLYLWIISQDEVMRLRDYSQQCTLLPCNTAFHILWLDSHNLLVSAQHRAEKPDQQTFRETFLYSLNERSETVISENSFANLTRNSISGQIAYRLLLRKQASQDYTLQTTIQIGNMNGNQFLNSQFENVASGCDLTWSPNGEYLAVVKRDRCLPNGQVMGIGFLEHGTKSYHEFFITQASGGSGAKPAWNLPLGWVVK